MIQYIIDGVALENKIYVNSTTAVEDGIKKVSEPLWTKGRKRYLTPFFYSERLKTKGK